MPPPGACGDDGHVLAADPLNWLASRPHLPHLVHADLTAHPSRPPPGAAVVGQDTRLDPAPSALGRRSAGEPPLRGTRRAPPPNCGIRARKNGRRAPGGQQGARVMGETMDTEDSLTHDPSGTAAAMAPSRLPTTARTGRNRSRLRVLILDDHALFAECLDLALTTSGHDVQKAELPMNPARSAKLLATVCRNRPDVVVLDLDLGAFGDGA